MDHRAVSSVQHRANMGSTITFRGSFRPSREEAALQALIPSASVITLTLRDAVMQALEHNVDIQVSRHTRDAQLTDIIFEQAKFDPTVQLGGRYDRTVSPLNRPVFGFGGVTAGNDPATFDQNDTSVNLGYTQRLLTGGSYDLTFDTNRNSVAGTTGFLFNPGYAQQSVVQSHATTSYVTSVPSIEYNT